MKRHRSKKSTYTTLKKPKSYSPMREHEPEIILSTTIQNIHSTIASYPPVWSEEQWLERKEKHKWLTSKNGYLGCSDCSTVQLIAPDKIQGLFLSSEWMNCMVNFNGLDKIQQLKSLRTKISAHKSSKAHIKAGLVLAECEKEKKQDTILSQQEEIHLKTIEKIFNSVYYIAKTDGQLTDYDGLIQLQIKNEINLGTAFHTHYNITEIIKHITLEFRKKLTLKLVTEEKKISIILDESTTLSRMPVILVYIKTVLDCSEEVIFLDMIYINDQKSDIITKALLNCLNSYGLTETYLQRNLVCFASDGASAILGKFSGVSTLLQDKLKLPELLIWNCLSHRLKLAVHDSISEINAINHFKSFIDTIHLLSNQSPKNWNELKTVASNLSLQLSNISRVTDVQWVSSSFQCINAVWIEYPVLYQHFKDAANDPGRTSGEQKRYTVLYQRMESIEFLRDLTLMHDVVEELSNLSSQLQDSFCTITRADMLIRRVIRVIDTFKDKPGEKEAEIMIASDNMMYRGIILTHNKRFVNINRLQFITSVVNNIGTRCFVTSASYQKLGNIAVEVEKYKDVLRDFEVLNPETWPENIAIGDERDVRYGDESIKNICLRFRLENSRNILNGFRDFFDNGGRCVPKQLSPLINAIKTIPCSSRECERGFNVMSFIMSNLQTKLLLSNMSSLMFLKLNGPPLSAWNSASYVKTWLQNHSAEDAQPRFLNSGEDSTLDKNKLWKMF